MCPSAHVGEDVGFAAYRPALRIAHIGDPQFGFCDNNQPDRTEEKFEENYRRDLLQFERVARAVNRKDCDLVLISGDMTQKPEHVIDEWPELLKLFKAPVVVTPGNHDMGNNVLKANLERFKSVFGEDYRAFDLNGWRIIAGNTQFWYDTIDAASEKSAYEEWVAAELENAKKYGGRVILAGHIPPFAYCYNEDSSHENYPLDGRAGRLESYLAANVRFYLSGHMHRLCARGYKSLSVLTAEATCFNYDMRPPGFRMFEVADDFSYTWKFCET